jgi:hypothetical protein
MRKQIEERLEEIESALDAFYGKVKESKRSGNSLVDEIEMYNDPSRDPYGSYEVGMALNEGEQPYCESLGYDWRDWVQVKKLLNEWKSLKDTKFDWESYLKVNHPNVWEELDNQIF